MVPLSQPSSGHGCEADTSAGVDPNMETPLAEALSRVRSMYDAGTPLFTRESIRDIGRQLSEVDAQKVTVAGLDGVPVEFEIRTGSTTPAGAELEWLAQAACIHYASGPWMLDPIFAPIEPNLVYCNLRIRHRGILRNKSTKETVGGNAPVRPLEDVEKSFQRCLQAWKTSDGWKQLKTSLSAVAAERRTPSSPGITKVVGFGCGPISTAGTDRLAERSLFQHALLSTVACVLAENRDSKSSGEKTILCYAQDPAYTDTDETVLARYGIVVLKDPDAFLEVDDCTAVLSFSPNVPVRQIASDLARPAVMIWDDIKQETHIQIEGVSTVRADPVSPRLRELVRTEYDELDFPGDREYFGDVAIYVRRPGTLLESTDQVPKGVDEGNR